MEPRSNEGQLMLALQAHRTYPGLSIRTTAKIYGVFRKTLKRRRDHVPSRQDIMPNCRKLTGLEESTIIQYVLDLDARSFPPRLRGVEDMANRLLADRDAPPVGINWASKFVKRHQEPGVVVVLLLLVRVGEQSLRHVTHVHTVGFVNKKNALHC